MYEVSLQSDLVGHFDDHANLSESTRQQFSESRTIRRSVFTAFPLQNMLFSEFAESAFDTPSQRALFSPPAASKPVSVVIGLVSLRHPCLIGTSRITLGSHH